MFGFVLGCCEVWVILCNVGAIRGVEWFRLLWDGVVLGGGIYLILILKCFRSV